MADPPHGSDISDVPPGVGESFRRLLHRCGPGSPRRSPVVLTIPTGAHGCSRGTEGLAPPPNLPPLRWGSEFRRAMRRTTPPSPPLQIFPSPAEDRAIHPSSAEASSSSSTARAMTSVVRPRGNLSGVGACFGACFDRPFFVRASDTSCDVRLHAHRSAPHDPRRWTGPRTWTTWWWRERRTRRWEQRSTWRRRFEVGKRKLLPLHAETRCGRSLARQPRRNALRTVSSCSSIRRDRTTRKRWR